MTTREMIDSFGTPPSDRGRLCANLENTAGHIPNLDGLRALSILTVMCSHFITNKIPGGLGVYVFFVISGFLIARQFFIEREKTGTLHLTNFYTRRLFRLYPVALFYTLVVLGGYWITGAEIDWRQPLSAIFYFANYLYAKLMLMPEPPELMPFPIFWSLSVEEHFYLLFPGLFMLLRGEARKLLTMLCVVILAILALRTVVAMMHPELLGTRYFYYRTEFRLDSIAFGVLIAVLCATPGGRSLLQRIASPLTLALSLMLILFCLFYRDPFFRDTLRYFLLGAALFGGVVSVLFSERLFAIQWLLNSRGLAYIGKLSYSLYLWHLLMPGVVSFVLPDLPDALRILMQFILAFVVSATSFHLLEQPFMAIRKRLHRQAEHR